MKTYALIGLILIIAGLAAFAYQGIAYTINDPVPMHLSAEAARTFPLPPVIGGLAFISGIVLLFTGNKKYEKAEKRQNRRWLR